MPGPNRFTEGLIDFSDVVATTTATNGEVLVNIGDATRGTGIDRGLPFWGIDGFLSRPVDADANGAAQYLYFCDGNQRYAMGSRDRRYLDVAGPPAGLDQGDRIMYSPSGAWVRIDDSDSKIECKVPGGSTLILEPNSFAVILASGAKLELTDTGFTVSLPTAIATEFTLDSTGAVISTKNLGQTINLDSLTQVTLGLNLGGLRPTAPLVENVNIGPGGGVTAPSPKVFAAST